MNNLREYNEIRRELNMLSPVKYEQPLLTLMQSSSDPGPTYFMGITYRLAEKFIKMSARIDALISKQPRVRKMFSTFRIRTRIKAIQNRPENITKKMTFPISDSPEVSIIIPCFNKFELTLSCLQSIIDSVSASISYEVVLVDNNSNDKTTEAKNIQGLNYIRSEVNLGFVDGCNLGASKATGEYIVFLNNDTIVTPGWLETLYDTLKKDASFGLVGSKILYPNGTLQEAGGIVYSDGSGSNYGKGDNPSLYKYNYLREVDYCSGASIMINKSLFMQLGGFDKLYSPAYYEDTDLSFMVRSNGYKVVYQPNSVVFHIEGATAGTNTNSGYKKYQDINRKKFLKKWSKELRHQYHNNETEYLARDRSGKKLALIIDENIPTPDKDSGSVRMHRMIKSLQELGYKISFMPDYPYDRGAYSENLRQNNIELLQAPFDFPEFASNYGKYYDLVILSRPRICSLYIDICQAYFNKAKIIYDTVDLHYLRLDRQSKFDKDPRQRKKLSNKFKVVELELIDRSDATLLVSSNEVKYLKKQGVSTPLHIVSNIHQIQEEAYKIGFNGRKDLLFVGGFAHQPNVDAIEWFTEEIFPKIREALPDIKLNVVGSEMSDNLRAKLSKQKGVVAHGFVENLEPILHSTRVFVAPLRFGAGVKGKIGQSIEFGIPVVTTSIGAEGMFFEHDKSCLIADSPSEFAKDVVDLYMNKTKWEEVRKNAKQIIYNHFSFEQAKKNIEEIL